MNNNRGCLIVFEGTDGTGKSTQLSLLANYLQDKQYPVVTTREPTEGKYGQRIRGLYLQRDSCTPREELELFLADRKEHVDNMINPALASGKIVLCDRYFLSTVAYQGAIGFAIDELLSLNSFAPEPDIAILLQASLDTGRKRITENRGEQLNDFEQIENLQKVAAIFDSLSLPFIKKISAQGSIESVHSKVLSEVLPIIPQTLRNVD
ncbi:MAG: dTMP kinase [Desulfotalea sp.]|nr:MAG: dTMP kinase [Desulfotalea sp.]